MNYKTGIGYDIHKFAKGRKLFLGGVEVAHHQGLAGHSDADVVLHALCDALLGAISEGDIGEHFPNTDKKYKNISSVILLNHVYVLVKKNFKVGNVDIVIQAEEPKLKEYKPKMRAVIAKGLNISMTSVNIKVTTCEGLGAIGQKKGIAAFATVLLMKKG